jgi:hypothetical protein
MTEFLTRRTAMDQPDVNELHSRYAAMTAEEFASLKREELSKVGQLAYDREIERRGSEAFKEEEVRKNEEFTARVTAEAKKRGMGALIFGTFLIYSAVFSLAMNAVRPNNESYGCSAFSGALGVFFVWKGAYRRERWKMPLGITWIVFGVISLTMIPLMQTAASQRNLVLEGSDWLLIGGGIMIIVGGLLLFASQKNRQNSGDNGDVE